jgi:transcription antitermination factor NusG
MRDPLLWHALRVRTAFEIIVAAKLAADGIDVFLPYGQARRRSASGKKSEFPLFQNYLFCRIDSEARVPVLMTPGVISFVGNGNSRTALNEVEIATLKVVVRSGLRYEPCAFVNTGQQVVIGDGPLKNFKGVLVESDGDHRIAFGVSLIRRSVLVELGSRTQILSVEGAHAETRPSPRLVRAVYNVKTLPIPSRRE